MPWREQTALDERKVFIRECVAEEEDFAEICRQHGISRTTGYKWLGRYEAEGEAGLKDRSRAPQACPHAVSPDVQQRILALRGLHPRWGPVKLRSYLKEHAPEQAWPAASTIGALLKRQGFTRERGKRRRTPGYSEPLAHAVEPNDVWSADYKGWFRCGNGERCDPLTISDACSRFLLRCRAVERTDEAHARAVFEAVFRSYGLPRAIRTDNGEPFASPAPGGLSRLSVWWLRLGIRPERIERGCPEQNGRHERLHRTLKQETASPPGANLRRQQEAFARFEQEYNYERPHQALGNQTPASLYRPSPREYPSRLPEFEYPAGMILRRVSDHGCFKWSQRTVFLSWVLAHEVVGFRETDDGLYEVNCGPVFLGWFDAVEGAFVADRGPEPKR